MRLENYKIRQLVTLLITSWYIVFGVGFHFHNSILAHTNHDTVVIQDTEEATAAINSGNCFVCLVSRTISMPAHTFRCPLLPSKSDYLVPVVGHIHYSEILPTDSGRSPPFFI
jgi:hypothetical protein